MCSTSIRPSEMLASGVGMTLTPRGNNMPEIGDPPTYNARYGFSDGAQTDALVKPGSNDAQPTSTDGTSPLDAAWRLEASVGFVLKALLPALWVALSR